MPLEKPDNDSISLIARARKALLGVETGPSVIARHAKTAPGGPGVYRMIDAAGEVLYIGKARGLKKRVQSYARAGSHNNRIAAMIASTAGMEFVTTPTETEALLLEANLIKRLKPRYNVVLQGRQVLPLHPHLPRPRLPADPEASRRAEPQGRLFRTVRFGRRRRPHHQHASARLSAQVVLRRLFRGARAAVPAVSRSSAAARHAPARSRNPTMRVFSMKRLASSPAKAMR